MTMRFRWPVRWRLLVTLFVLGVPTQQVGAQWVQAHEQFYLEASHNWRFRRHYPGADRLFNAFDYGHAVLYETLWRHPHASPARLEEAEYTFITRHLLNRPPAFPLEEAAIEPIYARLVPEAKLMFEWAHILHRQLYDVFADERLSSAGRDAEVARLVAYYKSRTDLAFSTRPKNMELMEGQRSVAQRGAVAWVAATSTTTRTVDGRDVGSMGAELMVLVRTPSGWRISAIHWSSRRHRS